MYKKSIKILIAEDNEDHAELIKRSINNNEMDYDISHVCDGEEALDYIFRRNKYSDPISSPKPDLIILDLRMPKVEGLDVLKEIKTSNITKTIPVVILTTSKAEQDMIKAYQYHVNSYLVKPVDFNNFDKLMNELKFYWISLNQHPDKITDN